MIKKLLLFIAAAALIFTAFTVFTAAGCQNTGDKTDVGPILIGPEEVLGAVKGDEVKTWVEESIVVKGLHQKTFGDYDVYVVAFGEKPTGGYEVKPGEVTFAEPNKLQFEAVIVEPAPGEMVTQVITYPHIIFAVEQGVEVNVVKTGVVREIDGEASDGEGKNLLDDVKVEGEGKYVQLEFIDKGNIFKDVLLIKGETTVERLKFTLEDGHNIYVEQDVVLKLVDGTSSFTVELQLPPMEGFLMLAVLAEVNGQWKDDAFVPIN